MGNNGRRLNGNITLAIKIGAILLLVGAAWQMLRGHETRIGDVEKKAHTTEIETVGIKKDIERLDEKVSDINTRQQAFILEQRIANAEILGRLPDKEP